MNSAPLVSVILCTYNGGKYIKKQIDSILNQTYPNIELVIVDDCSTDSTFEILTDYTQQSGNIKLYKNQETLGFNLNFNKAIRLGTGDFIAISDQDDIWLQHKIDHLMSNIGDKGIIFSNSRYINEKDELLDRYLLYNFNTSDYNSYKNILHFNVVTGHTIMFNKRMNNLLLPFPEKGYYDWWIGFIGLYHNEIIFLDEILTYYRIHSNSVMQQEKTSKRSISKNKISYENLRLQLDEFITYKSLLPHDLAFLRELRNAYINKEAKGMSMHHIKFLHKHFFELYPERRRKSLINNSIFFLKRICIAIIPFGPLCYSCLGITAH